MTRRGGNKGTNREGTVVTAAAAVDACELLSPSHTRVCVSHCESRITRDRGELRASWKKEKKREETSRESLSLSLLRARLAPIDAGNRRE